VQGEGRVRLVAHGHFLLPLRTRIASGCVRTGHRFCRVPLVRRFRLTRGGGRGRRDRSKLPGLRRNGEGVELEFLLVRSDERRPSRPVAAWLVSGRRDDTPILRTARRSGTGGGKWDRERATRGDGRHGRRRSQQRLRDLFPQLAPKRGVLGLHHPTQNRRPSGKTRAGSPLGAVVTHSADDHRSSPIAVLGNDPTLIGKRGPWKSDLHPGRRRLAASEFGRDLGLGLLNRRGFLRNRHRRAQHQPERHHQRHARRDRPGPAQPRRNPGATARGRLHDQLRCSRAGGCFDGRKDACPPFRGQGHGRSRRRTVGFGDETLHEFEPALEDSQLRILGNQPRELGDFKG
jgi:hypothetical protein